VNKYIAVALVVYAVATACVLGWTFGYQRGYSEGSVNPINVGAKPVQFSSQELQDFGSIKSRLNVYNVDPAFAGEDRILQWISMRNSSSVDYYQKSMEYLCFWSGQGANGEWEAVISIYNAPNSTSDFVVEVSRFTWHEIQVKLDGSVVADFPQVTKDTTSIGYATFHVHLLS
jgi:hypothetical protein